MHGFSLNMAEECDGGSVQPANETLLDHPLMCYDNELVEDERDIGLILPNLIYDKQGQEIRVSYICTHKGWLKNLAITIDHIIYTVNRFVQTVYKTFKENQIKSYMWLCLKG